SAGVEDRRSHRGGRRHAGTSMFALGQGRRRDRSGGTVEPTSMIRVLIVDDHEVLATSLAKTLDTEPDLLSVGVAGSLEKAAALIRTTAPDVLLLDHRLPDGDGVAAIGRLRELRPSMAIIVLTANAAEHLMVAAIEAGVSGFLSKTRSLG